MQVKKAGGKLGLAYQLTNNNLKGFEYMDDKNFIVGGRGCKCCFPDNGFIKLPTEEEFKLPEREKRLLEHLFDWQEQSAKTKWVLGEPLLH